MKLPNPRPGLVIRYGYLWSWQVELAQEEGKDRPCSVVVAAEDDGSKTFTYVLPITSKPPTVRADAVEIDTATKRRLGLAADRSWIMLTEVNQFFWPGVDLSPVDRRSGRFAYGDLPAALTRRLVDEIERRDKAGELKFVVRTE